MSLKQSGCKPPSVSVLNPFYSRASVPFIIQRPQYRQTCLRMPIYQINESVSVRMKSKTQIS